MEDSTLNEDLTPTAITELPRDSRDIYSFMYINPNVTQSGVSGDFKFIGAQSYGAAFSVDGQRANGGVFGQQTQSKPSLESVGEFNVLSNGFSAEYAGIASVRISTKRGGSEYHGSVFITTRTLRSPRGPLPINRPRRPLRPLPSSRSIPILSSTLRMLADLPAAPFRI